MTITKTNQIRVKTTSGVVTHEILKITRTHLITRDVRLHGEVMVTGYNARPLRGFWEQVKAGAITII